MGLIIPVMAPLISELKKNPVNEASAYGAWLLFAYAATQFICSPMLVILVTVMAGGQCCFVHWLALRSIIYPGTGSNIWAVVYRPYHCRHYRGQFYHRRCLYSRHKHPETRVKNFGLIGAAFGLGFMIGPLIGGVLGRMWGHRAPFYAAAILCFLNGFMDISFYPSH
jgi:DHA1 family tetracycline resistance protein-like MFS transporter